MSTISLMFRLSTEGRLNILPRPATGDTGRTGWAKSKDLNHKWNLVVRGKDCSQQDDGCHCSQCGVSLMDLMVDVVLL